MPSSRKRSKGQARKAKAKAAADSIQRYHEDRIATESILCKHGITKTDDICSQFIDTFCRTFVESMSMKRSTNHHSITTLTIHSMETAHNKFPLAVNNNESREITKKNFISNGASYLLRMNGTRTDSTLEIMSISCATALMMIDSYDSSSPLPPGSFDDRDAKIMLKNIDILNGCKRSLFKYFANQTPCNCLDESYALVKSTIPKMGSCICTECERRQYCSKACQLAHVPKHKDECRMWRSGEKFAIWQMIGSLNSCS